MALLHFSEDPAIEVFRPHVAPTSAETEPLVWAIDEERAPLYWFPRDCPRIAYWPSPTTSPGVLELFFAHTGARRVHAMESDWLERMRAVELFVYSFDPEPFEVGGGFYVARTDVRPLSVEPVGDLLALHAEAGIELRVTPSLRPLRDAIVALHERDPKALHFSMVRMRNADLRA